MDSMTSPNILSKHSKYCEDVLTYRRRATREVMVGDVGIGGNNPIRIQSMTTTDTMNTEATVQQVIELYETGCEIVRITAPSITDAENLRNIRDALRKQNIKVPLVADIHFTPNAAMKAAEFVEKVRINPGNYADKKKFAVIEYSDDAYDRELERIEETFKPLVLRCKEYGIAMRIGTNHGSLSDRIMNRFGDTPEGMVESALEFVRICEKYDYHDLVLSMKSSNPQVMIAAYRLLAARMYELDMDYPFHLGVTEAGDGEDGRIKSAVGIGTLLEDGLGDTIRVSLTEDSVHEIPAARAIADKYNALMDEQFFDASPMEIHERRNPFQYARRWSQTVELSPLNFGGVHVVRVGCILRSSLEDTPRALNEIQSLTRTGEKDAPKIEIVRCRVSTQEDVHALRDLHAALESNRIVTALAVDADSDLSHAIQSIPYADTITFSPDPELPPPLWEKEIETLIGEISRHEKKSVHFRIDAEAVPHFIKHDPALMRLAETACRCIEVCYKNDFKNCSVSVCDHHLIAANRLLAAQLHERGFNTPVVLEYQPNSLHVRPTLFDASIMLGSLLCDGIGDGILIDDPAISQDELIRLSYNILQATRLRISKTEFISCPSCGRTLFDLQEVTARIKSKTGHLKGVKIAIMGCIVNGPGEMADADFGYVGASAGKINLYVGKELIERNIDMAEADERLINLIRRHDKWTEP